MFDWNLETFRPPPPRRARYAGIFCQCLRRVVINQSEQYTHFSSEAIAEKSPSNQIVRADFTVLPCDSTLLILCNRCTVA